MYRDKRVNEASFWNCCINITWSSVFDKIRETSVGLQVPLGFELIDLSINTQKMFLPQIFVHANLIFQQ